MNCAQGWQKPRLKCVNPTQTYDPQLQSYQQADWQGLGHLLCVLPRNQSIWIWSQLDMVRQESFWKLQFLTFGYLNPDIQALPIVFLCCETRIKFWENAGFPFIFPYEVIVSSNPIYWKHTQLLLNMWLSIPGTCLCLENLEFREAKLTSTASSVFQGSAATSQCWLSFWLQKMQLVQLQFLQVSSCSK